MRTTHNFPLCSDGTCYLLVHIFFYLRPLLLSKQQFYSHILFFLAVTTLLKESICYIKETCIFIYVLSVYSPFSDRVGLPLHNIHIPSPFPSIMDIFSVDLKFGHIRFHTLQRTPFPQTPQDHFPEFTIIFPPLLPTITLDFPEFTFNPLPSRLALQSATRLPSCSIVGAIITRSSAYSKQTTSRLAGNNIHDSSKQQWTQY